MKKIFYSFTLGFAVLGMTLIGMLSSCEDVNDRFDQQILDSLTTITNVITYNYQLTDADYGTICTLVQKPIADLIKAKEAELKNAANAADSAVIKNDITALKASPEYILGNTIKTNKYFTKDIKPDTIVNLFLDTKYKYADEKSVTMLTYNLAADYDTTTVSSANKYTLLMADYDAMGTATGQPGKYDNFDAGISPTFFIPIWLKINNPYAKSGDVKLIRYKFYTAASGTTPSSTTTQKLVFIYDGANWVKYANVSPKVAKYVFKLGKWTFIDSDILVGLKTDINSNLGAFTPVNISGEQVWAWNSYKYMLMTGYVSGSYYDNEDWLISPAMNLTERVAPVLTFDHVGRYFGDVAGSNAKMKIAITIWVSTTSDGTAANFNAAQWTKLTLPESFYPSGANWTFITSGPLSLAAYKGNANVRFAFKYLSSAVDGAAGSWEVKNVYVYEP